MKTKQKMASIRNGFSEELRIETIEWYCAYEWIWTTFMKIVRIHSIQHPYNNCCLNVIFFPLLYTNRVILKQFEW